MLLTETRVCPVESTGAMACAYSPPHLHINYTTYGHPGKTGLGDGSLCFPWGGTGVPMSPKKWARPAARWAALFPGMCCSLAAGAGQRRSLAGEGAAAARLLFRHEFLSWHGCPQALYIFLIPISLALKALPGVV